MVQAPSSGGAASHIADARTPTSTERDPDVALLAALSSTHDALKQLETSSSDFLLELIDTLPVCIISDSVCEGCVLTGLSET